MPVTLCEDREVVAGERPAGHGMRWNCASDTRVASAWCRDQEEVAGGFYSKARGDLD